MKHDFVSTLNGWMVRTIIIAGKCITVKAVYTVATLTAAIAKWNELEGVII